MPPALDRTRSRSSDPGGNARVRPAAAARVLPPGAQAAAQAECVTTPAAVLALLTAAT